MARAPGSRRDPTSRRRSCPSPSAAPASPTPLTLPATASLLTGLTPGHHGLRTEALGGFGQRTRTLAERLQRAGFATLGLPGDPLSHARTGLARGFGSYPREAAFWPDSA